MAKSFPSPRLTWLPGTSKIRDHPLVGVHHGEDIPWEPGGSCQAEQGVGVQVEVSG